MKYLHTENGQHPPFKTQNYLAQCKTLNELIKTEIRVYYNTNTKSTSSYFTLFQSIKLAALVGNKAQSDIRIQIENSNENIGKCGSYRQNCV